MEFKKVVRDIRTLKIQGAESIAKEAVNALYHIVHKSKAYDAQQLILELHKAKVMLEEARPTEPCLRNALRYVLHDVHRQDLVQLVKDLDERIQYVQNYFQSSEQRIAEIGMKKLPEKAAIFTICHSSTVMMVLAKAKFSQKRFHVNNVETRPLFQGRVTAKELAALGVKVYHYIDSAARLALKHSDVFLFGADAVQSDGKIANKIGTELFLEVARRYDIPAYCCVLSWKFDPLTIYGPNEPIENRRKEEVWPEAPKGVTIMNPAFEMVEPGLVTGIISELGVYKPETFVDEVRRAQPWMF